MQVDLGKTYAILCRIVRSQDVITYEQLGWAYKADTGDAVSYRKWGAPLGEISKRCTDAGLPPISTVVVSASDGLPGDGYWGIPGGPPRKDYNAWKAVCTAVYNADWPEVLP